MILYVSGPLTGVVTLFILTLLLVVENFLSRRHGLCSSSALGSPLERSGTSFLALGNRTCF